jgi:hypothetical protein
VGKLEFMIFKQVVHEQNEFAHAGRQGDQGFFACGAQAQIKGFEEREHIFPRWNMRTIQ